MRKRILFCAIVLLVGAGSARALEPAEVLVVANANSPESVALAKLYAAARGIPAANVMTVKTTTAYEVSRADYDTQIAQPIRQALADRKLAVKIHSLCLLWGVPVRVAAPPAGTTGASSVYRDAMARAHRRLALDFKLLGSVGRKFPAPRTDGLTPLGKLFASPMPEPPAKLLKVADIERSLFTLLASKGMELKRIEDAGNRQIAYMQLMAIYLDVTGLKGLADFVKDTPAAGGPDAAALKQQLAEMEKKLNLLREAKESPETARKMLELMQQTEGAMGVHATAARHAKPAAGSAKMRNATASVDSELALLWFKGNKLEGQVTNPLHWRVQKLLAARGTKAGRVLMTARIDGPAASDAKRIIEDSVAVEKVGLDGTFYVDAGGPARLGEMGKRYDLLLTGAYSIVRAKSDMKAVLDAKPALFAQGSCPDAALYVGWYSLRKYVPAFTWKRGAVGWHVASFEAMHLRDAKSAEWCPQMIRNGVAATIGAVNEPFLQAFPAPSEFYPLLLTGQWTLAECYWRTCPSASWQMTLIGDPLYNPFAAKPRLKVTDPPPGLAPTKP
jgi:uncharacterized protein (TIGR03790 family)